MNVESFLGGAAFAAVITAIAAVVGKLIQRNTSVLSLNLDDRSKFVRNLMKRVEQLEGSVTSLQRNKLRIVNLLSSFSGEMGIISVLILQHIAELKDDGCDKTLLIRQCEDIHKQLGLVTRRVIAETHDLLELETDEFDRVHDDEPEDEK